MLNPVTNLQAAANSLTNYWSPRVVAEANGQYLKVAKLLGEVVLEAGDVHVVPRGVAHNPGEEKKVTLVLLEPNTTAHTGNIVDMKTKSVADQLD